MVKKDSKALMVHLDQEVVQVLKGKMEIKAHKDLKDQMDIEVLPAL